MMGKVELDNGEIIEVDDIDKCPYCGSDNVKSIEIYSGFEIEFIKICLRCDKEWMIEEL